MIKIIVITVVRNCLHKLNLITLLSQLVSTNSHKKDNDCDF